jgi:hypothetical protein
VKLEGVGMQGRSRNDVTVRLYSLTLGQTAGSGPIVHEADDKRRR